MDSYGNEGVLLDGLREFIISLFPVQPERGAQIYYQEMA